MTEQTLVIAPAEDWRREALIAALFGVIPIIGVLAWGWSPYALMLLFWFENAVIGVRQIAMMWLVAHARLDEAGAAIFQSGFFALHYGGFAAAHLLFTVLFFYVMGPNAPPADAGGGYPVELPAAFAEAWRLALTVPLGFAAIFGWQAVQLAQFVAREEARTVTLKQLMGEPYLRVVVLHVVLIIGAGLIMSRALAPQALVVLAIYKVVVDVGEIWWRARRKPPAQSVADLPRPPLGVAYDVATHKPDRMILWVSGVFVVFGLLMLAGGNFGFGVLWTAFAGFIFYFARRTMNRTRKQLIASRTNGEGQMIEGRVTHFTPLPRDAGRNAPVEHFKVSGVPFGYADNIITGGFNKTAYRGGPIREDLNVRIHYLLMQTVNVITRLEVLP